MTKKSSKAKAAQQQPNPTPDKAKRETAQMSSTAKTKERIEQRRKDEIRNRNRIIAAGLVVVAVLAGLLFLARTQPADAPVDAANPAKYEGIAADKNEQGFPRLGKADAPKRIVEYASFGCPGCYSFHQDVFPQILPYLKSGQANFTFIVQFTGEGNVEGAARAALCAAQEDESKFWEMHDVLFDWQSRFGVNAFNDSRLGTGYSNLGLNSSITACFYSDPINKLIDLAKSQQVQSTPTVLIDGVALTNPLSFDEIKASLGEVIPTADESAATQEATAEATSEATENAAATAEVTEAATEEAAKTAEATVEPTTVKPTTAPTKAPTAKPTTAPTKVPTVKPTTAPTKAPTVKPTTAPEATAEATADS